MSFGFSVGDFIAVAQVINNIVNSLRSIGGSKSEYQELVRELESLQKALQHLDRLGGANSSSSSTILNSIKYAALSCRSPLQEFLRKIERYEKSLGVRNTLTGLRATADKLRWSFGHKDEICKLQNYLNIHVGTINILLAEHGLEMLDLASTRADTDQQHIRERLEESGRLIAWIKDNVAAQTLLIQNTNSVVGNLLQTVSGDFGASLETLSAMVAKICVSAQQIYGVVLEIQGLLPTADIRWTFFQDPLVVEDALGRKIPVPSEYNYDLLTRIIEHKFSQGPGALEVQAGNYELSYTKNSNQVLSSNMELLPGSKITMAILVSKKGLIDEACPMPRCTSVRFIEAPGGGKTCCECNVWFDQSSKKRRSLQDLLGALKKQELEENQPRKRARLFEDDVNHFRNVRYATDEEPTSIELESDDVIDVTEKQPTVKTNRNTPEFDEALAYVDLVKSIYANQRHKYETFLLITRAFDAQVIDTPQIIKLMVRLFEGSDEARNGFGQFLPKNYTMDINGPLDQRSLPDLLYDILGPSTIEECPFLPQGIPKNYFEKSRLDKLDWGPPTTTKHAQQGGNTTSVVAKCKRRKRNRS